MRLTPDEINVLLEALKAWVQKDGMIDMMSALLPSMLAKQGTDERDDLESKLAADRQDRDSERKLRERKAIYISAKLLEMQEALA